MQDIEIIKYEAGNLEHAKVFADLNIEWIQKYFIIEDYDKKVLSDPDKYIIDTGGAILFAYTDNRFVGTVALLNFGDKTYELTKLGVTEAYKGRKIGELLTEEAIKAAIEMDAQKVFLVSNSGLTPALNLYQKMGFVINNSYIDSRYQRGDIAMDLDLNKIKKGVLSKTP